MSRAAREPLVEVRGLHVEHVLRSPWRRAAGTVQALRGVDLALEAGETLALVGESGCGKTTVARALVGLVQPSAGAALLQTPLGPLDPLEARGAELLAVRRTIQIVFQDPMASLNPRQRVGAALEEVLGVHGERLRARRTARAAELLARVGLAGAGRRWPHELSGGERQRVAIARALAVGPRVIVFDEAVSSLDVSVRAQLLELLAELQRDEGLAYLFVSHDLALVRHFAHRVAVLYAGRIVEEGDVATVLSAPRHPYTRALRDAAPHSDPRVRGRAAVLAGEPPSALAPPAGCAFHPRCALAEERCGREAPAWTTDASARAQGLRGSSGQPPAAAARANDSVRARGAACHVVGVGESAPEIATP